MEGLVVGILGSSGGQDNKAAMVFRELMEETKDIKTDFEKSAKDTGAKT